MNNSIIEQLFYCKRGNSEEIKITKEYSRLLNEISKLDDAFTKNFNDEQRKQYNEIFLLHCGLESEVALSHFIEGMKIGMRLAFESFVEIDEK